MSITRIYVCDDSIEGIFSAVSDIFKHVALHETTYDECKINPGSIGNYELFSEYIEVETDQEKALKITKMVCDRLGFEAYQTFLYASACIDDKKGTAILRCIVKGLYMEDNGGFKIINLWTDSDVAYVNELRIKASNEFARWREFLEFKELNNGLLFSRIGPVCDILMLLAPHFSNRLPNENFMIYDEIRDKYLVHERGRACYILYGNGTGIDEDSMRSTEDLHYAALFKTFTESIAIKERTNLKLQQQLMPLRIQKYKIEF